MSFLNALIDAVTSKPQPQPANIDHQQQRRLAAIEADKLKQADDNRLRSLHHSLADGDRRKLNEKRDAIVNARKQSGKPLIHAEIRILDCEIELRLAELAYGRDPGQPHIFGDGTKGISKPQSRVNAAKRALKAAEDAYETYRQMIGVAQPAAYVPAYDDAIRFLNNGTHMADVLASHGIK